MTEIFKRLWNILRMFQFSCRFAFLSAFRISNRTPKITRILTHTAYQANAPTLTIWIFLNFYLSSLYFANIICRHLNIYT